MSEAMRRERIEDLVETWHTSGPDETRELYEWLGWTWIEYKAYVERGELPPVREGAA